MAGPLAPAYTGGMDSLAVLEAVFSALVGLAALGVAGVGIRVLVGLFKVKR